MTKHTPALDGVRGLAMLLVLAWLVRLAWVLHGGQYAFEDETRYDRALYLLALTVHGHPIDGLRFLLAHSDHIGWTLAALPAATVQAGVARVMGVPALTLPMVGAGVLSLASVGVVGMLYPISRRLGADEPGALLATALGGCASSLAVWSSHLMPYDTAMLLALVALWVGLGGPSLRRTLGAGVLVGSAFAVYEGYWLLAGVVALLPILRDHTAAWRRIVVGGLGLALPLATLAGCAALVGVDLLGGTRHFAGTVTQGRYDEGFTLPVRYLLHTDPVLFVAGLGSLVVARRGSLVAVAIIGIYAALGLLSVAHVFVVYGRLVRQLVPFLCLLVAWAAMRTPRVVAPLLVASVLSLALTLRGPDPWFEGSH